jgi:hypothetical protein
MVTHFTAFGIPQPLWTHSGYVVLYALPALFIARRARTGTLTPAIAYRFAAVEFGMSCVFEMVGINGGAYAYWGPHVLRVLNYPLIIGILETAQVMVFAVAAAAMSRRLSPASSGALLFVLFPCTFLGINFGAGWPTIVAIHLATPAMVVTAVGTLLSIGLALVVIHTAVRLGATGESVRRPVDDARPLTAESV